MSLANKRRKLPYHPMPSSSALRLQIERAVEHRFPSALTPIARTIHEVAATGIAEVDELLDGGLPVGAISELTGPESSGRTSLALAFVAQRTATDQMCAWVDVADALRSRIRRGKWSGFATSFVGTVQSRSTSEIQALVSARPGIARN